MTSNFFVHGAAAMTSNDDTWTTPKDKFQQWDSEFNFVLDAAALSTSALCDNWYGPDHPDAEFRDALTRDWFKDSKGGTIWLNPPYGRSIGRWMEKAHSEAKLGATVVCLAPSRTDTKWFHDYCIMHEVRYLRGRLKFGGAKTAAPFPSALVIMKPKIGRETND
jgi:phage N-6-adenine-methyltransferase